MAKYFIFPGVLPDQLSADTLDEAITKARGLALSGHESATVFTPVWGAVRSEALTETYLDEAALKTAAEMLSLENAHADLNAKAATISLVGGPDTSAVLRNQAGDVISGTDEVPSATPATQADGFPTQATEAQPDPSRTPFNPGL